MSSPCKGECDRQNESQLILGYKNGQKYCKKCVHYFITKSVRCICCKNVLRSSKKYNKVKQNNISSSLNNQKELL